MRIPPGRVGNQRPFMLSHGLCKPLGAPFQVNLTEGLVLPGGGGEGGDGRVYNRAGRARSTERGVGSVDDGVADEFEEFLTPVGGGHREEEGRVAGDEAGVDLAVDEVCEKGEGGREEGKEGGGRRKARR